MHGDVLLHMYTKQLARQRASKPGLTLPLIAASQQTVRVAADSKTKRSVACLFSADGVMRQSWSAEVVRLPPPGARSAEALQAPAKIF